MSVFTRYIQPLVLRIGSTRAVVVSKKKLIFDEPARVAISLSTGNIIAFGQAALDLGKLGAPDVQIVPLFRDGIPRDGEVCRQYLLWMRDSFTTTRLRRIIPYTVVTVTPVGLPRAYQSLYDGALKAAHFFPVASYPSVVGDAWMEIGKRTDEEQLLMIRIGATQTQVCFISHGIVVAYDTIWYGGEDLDRAFVRFLRGHYDLSVPLPVVVTIKEEYTKAQFAGNPFSTVVRGKHTQRGDVTSLTLKEADVTSLYRQFLEELSAMIGLSVRSKIQTFFAAHQTLPVYLSGGLSSFADLEGVLQKELGAQIHIVSRPTVASVIGIASKIS